MFYELAFRAQYAEKRGTEFQRFVEDVLEKKYGSGFRRVKPSGRIGDEKNDGYIPEIGMYLQVHAPSTLKQTDLARKMDEDFEGAVRAWNVETWVFVHNDREGMSAPVNHKIDELNARRKGICAVAWNREDLRKLLFSLPEEDIAAVLGVWSPTFQTMTDIGMDDLRDVIAHVASQSVDPLSPIRPVPQDKVKRNKLSEAVEDLLRVGMARFDLVERYFATDPNPALGSEIASAIHGEYERLRDSGMGPEDVFQELWGHVHGRDWRGSANHECAALAVLAYFFSTCDIFERSEQDVRGSL